MTVGHIEIMARVQTREIYEAEELLAEIDSWSGEEIAALPGFTGRMPVNTGG